MKSFLHVVMLESDTAKVSATDDAWFTIRCEGAVEVTISMRPDAADRICTALGQLLTDRHVRKHGTAEQLSAVTADQVERAELLADAPPRGPGGMKPHDNVVEDGKCHDPLCHGACGEEYVPHDEALRAYGLPTGAADMTEGELILGRRVPPQ